MEEQEAFWKEWLTRSFGWEQNQDNARRGACVLREIERHKESNLKILDVGCGTGWLSKELQKYGEVTATDLASRVIQGTKERFPEIKWVAGDFLQVDLPESYFHIVTCLETIAHVSDQSAFASKIAKVIKLHGSLILTTQNEYVWKRTSWLKPPGKGQIRNWPSRKGLKELFQPYFIIEKIFTCAPGGDQSFPWIFNNRVSIGFWSRLLGKDQYVGIREKIGLGKSIVLVARRSPHLTER